MVDSVSGATAGAAAASAAKADAATLNKDFDQFLLLLTTQLQNQDPLDPMDSAEFTNQLVAFSGVEQQIKANEMMEQMLALNVLNITSIGLGFIGLDVERLGENFMFDGENATTLGYAVGENAASTQINILNEDGDTVLTVAGESGFGKHDFTWDGLAADGTPLPAGKYRISVTSTDTEGKPVEVTTTVPSRVTGIESGENGDVILIVAGGEKVSITDVRKATQPGTSI